jgi:rare lipoprotein A
MKLLKYLVIISACIQLSACAHDTNFETEKKEISKKREPRTFDILGNTDGENEINYDKYAAATRFSDETYKVRGQTYSPVININYSESGTASWYGGKFHGRKTSSGVVFDKNLYTAAHRTLPIPSVVRVVNLDNHRSALVVINDRGPFKGGKKRIIDLSKKAAEHLGMMQQGVGRVKVEYLYEDTKQLLAKLSTEERGKAMAAYQHALTTQMAKNDLSKKHRS